LGIGETASSVPAHAGDSAALDHHISLYVQVPARVERAYIADDD
jgi:hypothetical protein